MDNSAKLGLVIKAIISILVLILVAGGEGIIIFKGVPAGIDQVILGRILGTLDAAGLIVLTYWFGSSTDMRSQVEAIAKIGQTAAATPITIYTADGRSRVTSPTQEQAVSQAAQNPGAGGASHM